MWSQLWCHFRERALSLLDGHDPRDAQHWAAEWQRVRRGHFDQNEAVDWTIRWQLIGIRPYISVAASLDDLQLPELYSGHPWTKDDAPWIAFVTTNPSISSDEIFPRRHHLLLPQMRDYPLPKLIAFFERRFHSDRVDLPMVHGRHHGQPAYWVDDAHPSPRRSETWTRIDTELTACMVAHGIPPGPAPLGLRAAIIDVVPWKFKAWGRVPSRLKRALILAGAPYLHWTLHAHPPGIIVAAGRHSQIAVRSLFDEGLIHGALPVYDRNKLVRPGEVEINGQPVQWLEVPHPSPLVRGYTFTIAMEAIRPLLAAALDQ